jgi:acetylglutamate kinase
MLPAGEVRIYLACGVTDMRGGFHSLAARVQTVLQHDPYSGALFIFRGRRGDLIKCLFYDRQGMCLYTKKLDRGRFIWPQAKEGVGITVEEAADDETLDEMGIESSWELTGLYRGTPLIQRSIDDIPRQPDLVFLYREAILPEWIDTSEDLFRNVLVHEIAHHFGFSDAEIEALERDGLRICPRRITAGQKTTDAVGPNLIIAILADQVLCRSRQGRPRLSIGG